MQATEPASRPLDEGRLSDRIPYLTFGLVVLLAMIFVAQEHFAFDEGQGHKFSLESLLAMGALSFDLAVRSGEWWRMFLAPLLHGDGSHLLGNSFAFCFIGIKLEPLIGRGWFAALFVIGALGGEVGSLYGNPPSVPTVGASGAITALVAALFTLSFHGRAADDAAKMRSIALRFGVPALLPLAFGASGHVDYYAHLGGAVAGVAVALALPMIWPDARIRPAFGGLAMGIALAGLAASGLSCGFAAAQYPSNAAKAAQLIPQRDLPTKPEEMTARSAELVARYPADPRAHLFRASYHIGRNEVAATERELRIVLDQVPASAEARFQPIRRKAQTILALALAYEGRRAEARSMGLDACRSKATDADRTALVKAKLCD